MLIREMAMNCGYSAASLSDRLYAWRPEDGGRTPAAGLLIDNRNLAETVERELRNVEHVLFEPA